MDSRKAHDRHYRTILMVGLALSFGAHVAVLAFAKVSIPGSSAGVEAMRVVDLAAPMELVAPLEVVRLPETSTQSGGGEPSSARVRDVSIPAFASVPAVLTAVVPNPIALLEKIEEDEKPDNPVASYAMITDFRADAAQNPSSLRSMDDRPVAVLAALGRVGGSGAGVTIGGGHCPSPGGLHQIAFSRTGPTF